MNTKKETETKEVTDSVSSAEKELPGCPGKTFSGRSDVKDKDGRLGNTGRLVLKGHLCLSPESNIYTP